MLSGKADVPTHTSGEDVVHETLKAGLRVLQAERHNASGSGHGVS